jgi:ankyrin repeat protein
MISAEDDELLHQIADEDDDVDHDEDLEPTPEFLDPTTQRTLESADKLLAEFELTLSALSAEDEFDTALIVDSADDVERLFRNNQELAKKFTWPRLMQTAIEHGMAPRVLKLCIDRGAKVNTVDAERQMATPLVACIRNRTLPHMWQLLLDNGADPNKGDAELSVMQHAILAGKLDMMWALKTAGVDIDLVDTKGRGTPLRFAIAMRAIDSALELIDMGADCTYALHGQSLLHFVTQPPSFDREAELVRALVLKGASINARDGLGRTPLLCAVHENRQPLVSVFLELGIVSSCLVP